MPAEQKAREVTEFNGKRALVTGGNLAAVAIADRAAEPGQNGGGDEAQHEMEKSK